MNDTTKPAAKAVAHAHKAPSRATIDTAQDELANLNYKLGRAQVAAMLSSGQAKADRAAVEELTALVEEKRQAVEAMVETFTNPTRSDPAVALDAIRSKLGQVDQANAPGAPGDPVAAAKLHDGGPVKQGVAYMVGEKTGEAIIPRVVKATVIDSAGDRKDLEIDLDKPIQAGTFKPRAYNVEDPESLNWGNDTVAEKGTAVAGVVYETRTGDIVGEFSKAQGGVMILGTIENAKPGDVEIPDTADATPPANHALHTGPLGPTYKPLLGDIWTDTSVSPPFDRTWDGARWAPAFPPAKPHKATRPPLDPVQGATWTYPRSNGDLTLTFDTVEGWQIFFAGGPNRRAVAEDLSSDFWEKGELEHVLNAARPRKQLFGRG